MLFKTSRGRGCKSRFVSKDHRSVYPMGFFCLTYSLAQWTALADGDLVTLLNTESWRNVRSEVLVALLVTGVLWDEVEVLAADDEGSVHLGGDDGSGEDTATDRHLADEWALLVCEARNVSSWFSSRFPLIFVVMRLQELEVQPSPPPQLECTTTTTPSSSSQKFRFPFAFSQNPVSTYQCRFPQWRSLGF